MGVKVTFLRDEEGATTPAARAITLVPKAAVLTDKANNFVGVVVRDRVERRAVTVGGADGDRVEVLGALRSGERVVLSPPPNLGDGATVVVK
jgi:multidrug efflux pump subunit AcrA (membrane-fusion protein)